MSPRSGTDGFGRGGGPDGHGGDPMTEQMHTLLEMLRAAQADDMPALAEAEARALRNKQERKRVELMELQSKTSREQKDPNEEDQHHEDVHPEEEDGTCMWEDDSRDMTRIDDAHTLMGVPLKPSPAKPRYLKKTTIKTTAADMAASKQSLPDPKVTVEKTEKAADDDESIGIDDLKDGKDDDEDENEDELTLREEMGPPMSLAEDADERSYHPREAALNEIEPAKLPPPSTSKTIGQPKRKADSTNAPANPSSRKHGSDNDEEIQSLLATAKIKYKLCQLSSTLNKDDKASRFSSIADPLLIDKDGFMVTEATGSEPFPNDVFEADFAAAFGSSPDEKDEKKRKPKGSELLAAKRRELQADQQKLRQSGLKRSGGAIGVLTVDDNQDNKSFMTTEAEKDVREKVMALAAGETANAGVSDINRGERNFSTIQYDDNDDDISKIDAVEAATKERIKMLRRVVAEKAAQPSKPGNNAGRGDIHHPDEPTTTLEQETMKQIDLKASKEVQKS